MAASHTASVIFSLSFNSRSAAAVLNSFTVLAIEYCKTFAI